MLADNWPTVNPRAAHVVLEALYINHVLDLYIISSTLNLQEVSWSLSFFLKGGLWAARYLYVNLQAKCYQEICALLFSIKY